jgi:hypothetical protein
MPHGVSSALSGWNIASTKLPDSCLRELASSRSPMPTSTARVDTHGAGTCPTLDSNLLAPRDALYGSAASAALSARKRRARARSSDRRQEGRFKKLLWFKQPCKHDVILNVFTV